MLYDLTKDFDKERFKKRVNSLYSKSRIVEVKDLTNRSLRQNAYLHTILSFFAYEIGETMQYVKDSYYKRHCNSDLFVVKKFDSRLNQEIQYVKSSSELSKEEMTMSIQRFRDFASQQGVYIPSADEHKYVNDMALIVEQNKNWILC